MRGFEPYRSRKAKREWQEVYGNLAEGENIHTLWLESELSDLRAGYANPIRVALRPEWVLLGKQKG